MKVSDFSSLYNSIHGEIQKNLLSELCEKESEFVVIDRLIAYR